MGKKTVKSAAQIASNWNAAMQDPKTAQKYSQGINNVTVNPMALAAAPAAQQKYKAATASAVDSGRMATALNNTSVQTWKSQASASSQAGFARGAQKGMPKMTAAMGKMQAGYQAASDAAAAIPNDGTQASITGKVVAAINAMKTAAGKPTI